MLSRASVAFSETLSGGCPRAATRWTLWSHISPCVVTRCVVLLARYRRQMGKAVRAATANNTQSRLHVFRFAFYHTSPFCRIHAWWSLRLSPHRCCCSLSAAEARKPGPPPKLGPTQCTMQRYVQVVCEGLYKRPRLNLAYYECFRWARL